MGARLLVSNLSRRTTEEQLRRFFSSWGSVVKARIPRDGKTGRSRGFGVVEYDNEDLSELALSVFNGRQLGGRVLSLRKISDHGNQPAQPERQRPIVQGRTARLLDDAEESGRFDDYARDQRPRKRKGGKHAKHGSDRKHGRGTRRVID